MTHPNDQHINDLCIIGGGLAGIASAIEARRLYPHWKIVLIESRSRLGGRAGSFVDPKTKNWVDNCQHVGLGCCTELIEFVNRLGSPDAFRRIPELRFLSPDGRVGFIRSSKFLPPPLHLAPSFLKIRFLNSWDKITLALGLLKLALTSPQSLKGQTVLDWLNCNFQTPRSIRRLWEPVLVSALNDSLDKLDIAIARQVFVKSFFKSRSGFHMLVPAIPLGELFDERARTALSNLNIQILDNTKCQSIENHESFFEIQIRGKSALFANQIIVATPWPATSDILNSLNINSLDTLSEKISRLESSPITGIHLLLDKTVCPHSEIALLDTTIQWVFDHTLADRRQPGCILPANGQSLHIVISASHQLAHKNRNEILDEIRAELDSAFPEMQSATILSAWIVTEHAATFSPSPESDSLRPTSVTPLPRLYLAGDWTQTGWPATMEGAIRSGLNAARSLI